MSQTPQGPERFVDAGRRYRLESRIATGGMGEVWRGTDTALDRTVAVKLLKSEYADDPTFRTRFESEARHAAALHHPNVAAVYDVGEAAPTDGSGQPVPFLVMELVDGQPLSVLLRGGRKLSPTAMRDLLAQAADGIGAAHRAGVVHRDVKPANLMVTPDRQIKITDFGIARASDGLGLTGTGQVMGTPQYLSPEQARGNPATPASDVYSLGVVAWECLAGHRPFEKESAVATALAHLNDPVPPLPDSVPSDLAIVVERALAKDPAQRYPDGDALAAALRDPATAVTQVVGSRGVVPPVAPVPVEDATMVMPAGGTPPPVAPLPITPTDLARPVEPPARRDGGGGGIWWVLAGILVVGALIAFLLLRGTGSDDADDPVDPTSSAPTSAAPSPSPSESPTEEESPTPSPTPDTIDLDEGRYLGRDIDVVTGELTDLGLTVRPREVANPGDEQEGAVSDITPTDGLEEGDTVVVSFYGEAEQEPEPEPSQSPTPSPTQSPSPSITPGSATSSPAASPSGQGGSASGTLPAPTTPTPSGQPAQPGAVTPGSGA